MRLISGKAYTPLTLHRPCNSIRGLTDEAGGDSPEIVIE